jgi:predicted permease
VPALSDRWVEFLIRLFPEDFRHDYGADLLSAFKDQRDDASVRSRMELGKHLKVATTTTKVSWHLLKSALEERRAENARRPPAFQPRNEHMIRTTMSDLKYGLRGLLKQPGFTAISTLTLALGVGACTAIFSVVNGILLTPLPYLSPDQLVSVRVNSGIDADGGFYGTSEPEFWDFSSVARSFVDVGAMSGTEVTLGDSTGVRRIRVLRTTAGTLPMLGVNPELGRFFTPEEDLPGAAPTIVLSYGLWQTEFAGDPNVLGRTVIFDVIEQPLPIVGVMPAGFEFPDDTWEAWIPLSLNREDPWARNNHYLDVVARLAPEISLEEAQSEMNVLAARSTTDYPEYYPGPGYRIRLDGFHERIAGDVATPLFVLLGAVGFVVLMACVNVSNLLLARGETRKREIAIRNAVGASGRRLTQQLITENLLLAGVGGLFGIAVALVGTKVLLAMAPSGIPRLGHVRIDGAVLVFSLLVSVATGLLFGLVPAVQAARSELQEILKEGGGARGSSRTSHTLRRILVAIQVTLAVVLASGAGLMLRSVRNMYDVDTGFSTENVLTLRLNPSATKYDTGELRVAFYEGLLDQIKALPGVNSASAVFSLPLAGGTNNWSILVEGREAATIGDAPAARVQLCTPEYFETLGLTLLRGRFFDENDVADSPPVVVISETMARTHWPNEDPLGKRMKVWDESWPWLEVIGVVKDVRHRSVDQEPRTWWYVPYSQGYVSAYYSPRNMNLTVHSELELEQLAPLVRNTIGGFDASAPISRLQSMDQVFARSINGARFVTVLLAIFGLLALFLASVGVYGVISYAVSLRTHEIGLRRALGESGKSVLGNVLREGFVVSMIGVILGLLGSLFLSRFIETMVFGIAPTDPLTYTGVVAALLAAATGASLLPALRASRVDPMVALRIEN